MTERASVSRRGVRPQAIEWGVRNFKALENATLPLASLNVLVGANSSGKSSLIQSLLLLAQSTPEELILNGPLVRLGDPIDVISTGSDTMTLGYVASMKHMNNSEVILNDLLVEITLAAVGSSLVVREIVAMDNDSGTELVVATSDRVNPDIRDEVLEPRLHQTLLRVRIMNGKPASSGTYVRLSGLFPDLLVFKRTPEQVLREMRKALKKAIEDPEADDSFNIMYELTQFINADKTRIPARFRDSVPSRRIGFFSALSEFRKAELRELLEKFVQTEVPKEAIGRLPLSAYSPVNHPASLRFQALIGVPADQERAATTLAFARDALGSLRQSIRYLGPLREEPQVVSPTGARYDALPAGPRGEYTADLLSRSNDTEVNYRDWAGLNSNGTVAEALTRWISYLGVGEDVSVEDQGKLGRGLRIKLNGVERDLTTIGVGASQLVPVLSVVLTAPSGSLVLLEQPELHLHPSVQSRLADFFLWSRPDVAVVVETHSEYMITRLRRRVVESAENSDRIAILFAEQHNGYTDVRRLHVGRLGDFSDWPSGFFDTQDEEARALVVAVRKILESESAN
ncbi:AAA family ATPase [Williamsia sp.]|uniref:AAA family ATPase n=1 Tax=Williamsia sp. TaxID=1872085 RepID=UPI002F93F608